MTKKINLEGQNFGRLIVKRYLTAEERNYRMNTWLCQCECGNETHVSTSHLKNGNVKSCGCLNLETQVCLGNSGTPTYVCWRNMVKRCHGDGFDMYKEKGRTVCDRWMEVEGQGYLNFLADMGEQPEGLTLERKDNSLGYSPENCIWAGRGLQGYNRDKFSNNTSGRTGVYPRQNKYGISYRVKINVNGKTIELGNYTDYELACFVREEAELTYYGFIKE